MRMRRGKFISCVNNLKLTSKSSKFSVNGITGFDEIKHAQLSVCTRPENLHQVFCFGFFEVSVVVKPHNTDCFKWNRCFVRRMEKKSFNEKKFWSENIIQDEFQCIPDILLVIPLEHFLRGLNATFAITS